METKLFDGPFPFTPEWYKTREHAPHLEQAVHQPRMHKVAGLALDAVSSFGVSSIVDLGAGDGGMLSLLAQTGVVGLPTFGYDLMPVNVRHAHSVRQVDVRYGNFETDDIEWGQMAICTEVLEHLEDPHAAVKRIGEHCDFLIASSPSGETREHHDASHAWAWDMEGYVHLLQGGGFNVIEHEDVTGDFNFQVALAVSL